MIKDVSERQCILERFPEVSEKKKTELEKTYMQHYLIYRKKRRHYECYCTHCRSFFNEKTAVPKSVSHGKYGDCPICGKRVLFLSEGCSRKRYDTENFIIFMQKGEELFIRCFSVYERFNEKGRKESVAGLEDNYPLEFSWYEQHRYYISKEQVQHWTHESGYKMVAVKSEKEPYFNNYGGDIVVMDNKMKKGFLKYAVACHSYMVYNHKLIEFLCEYVKHPNIEYLIKAGFEYVIDAKINDHNMCGVRINYRTSDVKKMLGLNKKEMELFAKGAYGDCYTLGKYQKLKKLTHDMSPEERLDIIRRYSTRYIHFDQIILKVGISVRSVCGYIDRLQQNMKDGPHSGHATISDWNDYLDQCRLLNYDMSDPSVVKPKDLAAAHERLTRIIKIKADKEARELITKRNEKLEKMRYIDDRRGLQIVLPESAEDIINEGKQLSHCVGGYAERHAKGKLNILFLRKTSEPETPYYTMEVDLKGNIVQCRGYKNNCAGNPKPQEIIDFEKEYQQYLDELFGRCKTKLSA